MPATQAIVLSSRSVAATGTICATHSLYDLICVHPPNPRHPRSIAGGTPKISWEGNMVSAVVLLKCKRNTINAVAETLAGVEGVSEVFSVAGQYDLVAILRVRDNNTLADLVTSEMLQVDGIVDSETLIAFKVFSRHDLESMFEIGFEAE
jgi:DNA-binding Lrp family transcriptional regulator